MAFFLSLLSTLVVAGGESLGQNAAQCGAGGPCVEDERVLIQKTAAASSWDTTGAGSTDDDKVAATGSWDTAEAGATDDEKAGSIEEDMATIEAGSIEDDKEESELEFTLSQEEFANASVLIPQKLKAAGLTDENDVDGLMVYTRTGTVLQAEPSKADFPLKLRYERQRKPMPDHTNYTTSQLQLDMMRLAGNAYNFSKPTPKCWKRELIGRKSTWYEWMDLDHFTLSTCQCAYCKVPDDPFAEVCAVAFSGANDGNDVLNILNVVSNGAFCGRQDYHMGFAEEVREIIKAPDFAPFTERMKKCNKLIFTGHSLGGAVASIVARCVNCRHNCGVKPVALRDLTVEAHLHTIGAPAPTVNGPLKNDLAKDGTFKGTRFWNYKRACFTVFGCQDPVPWVMGKMMKAPFVHPKMETVGLGMAGGIRAWDADNEDAVMEPMSFMLPAWSEHAVRKYRNRVKLHMES